MNIDKEVAQFCRNICILRRSKGLTQKEMARILGISVGSLRKIERGILPYCVTVGIIYNIYNAFDILPSSLIQEKP